MTNAQNPSDENSPVSALVIRHSDFVIHSGILVSSFGLSRIIAADVMAVFTYKAIDGTRSITGTFVADTARQVRDQLHDRGLTVQEVVAKQTRAGIRLGFLKIRRAYPGRVVEFVRDLSTLLGVGVPLLDSLRTLSEQQTGGFKSVLLQLQDRVSAGASLARAMRDHPAVFDVLDVSVAEVGETAGTLDVVLNRLADFKENSAAVRGRIGAALLYPAIVLVVAVGVSVLLMTFVVPKLLGALIDSGRPIPLVTRIVKSISDAILSGWWAGLGVLVLVVFGIGFGLSTTRGRRAWDRWQLRIPLVGPAIRKQAISRMAMVMATLLRGGGGVRTVRGNRSRQHDQFGAGRRADGVRGGGVVGIGSGRCGGRQRRVSAHGGSDVRGRAAVGKAGRNAGSAGNGLRPASKDVDDTAHDGLGAGVDSVDGGAGRVYCVRDTAADVGSSRPILSARVLAGVEGYRARNVKAVGSAKTVDLRAGLRIPLESRAAEGPPSHARRVLLCRGF